MQAKQVVLTGLTTDHCVATTARMAGNLGFETFVVADATATFERKGVRGQHYSAEEMHDTALTSLNGEFATILTTQDLSADRARFTAMTYSELTIRALLSRMPKHFVSSTKSGLNTLNYKMRTVWYLITL